MNEKKRIHCIYCGADENNSIEENLECINSCTNCIADLTIKGKWTGVGYKIMEMMIKKHGLDYVKYTSQKMAFKKV